MRRPRHRPQMGAGASWSWLLCSAPYKPYSVLAGDQETVLRVLFKTDSCPLLIEEIAAMASLSFERGWYTVVELIELRFMTPAGISLYVLTRHGRDAANRIA